MSAIRVLVVDDSIVVRRILTTTLGEDPALQVVGSAAHGRIGLNKIQQLQPDVVTLDMEMPEMDGLATLAEIRKLYPKLPVIMFSTLTERGAVATLDALALGANDYVTKPANVGSVTESLDRLRKELIPKIKAFGPRPTKPVFTPAKAAAKSEPRRVVRPLRPPPSQPVELVAVGSSTGGPNALAEFLSVFPADFPVPLVLVQHMPPVFTRFLAERLDGQCKIGVAEAKGGEALIPGQALIAPGDHHMRLSASPKVTVKLDQGAPVHFCRPAVDVLFESVATLYGGRALGVILTGMGQDGLLGCEKLRDRGALIMAQDEASSVVWGMPGHVVRAGLSSVTLPPKELGRELVRRVLASRSGRGALSVAARVAVQE
ncbi:MAG: chemotaxis response regulator protein-glutamate methylesterase [Myxococcales bacterium]|nr:chemotaxis response regulator protein-glutamate methylesterase [Myxococcales bacterium]